MTDMIVAHVPPDKDPLILKAVIDSATSVSGPEKVLRVLLARKTMRSEGIESKPHAGTMMEWVLEAM